MIKKGLSTARYSLFRFPNGSLSNDYHWNGQGTYTADSIWECDSLNYLPGFVVTTKYRGTSKEHYGFSSASRITDGDTGTFWWSDPLITGTDPCFYVEFKTAQEADSASIYWGGRYGVDFKIQRWLDQSTFYPGPHQTATNKWETVDSVTNSTQLRYAAPFAKAVKSPYYRVVVTKMSHPGEGVQVCEFKLFSKGAQVTVNIKKYQAQGESQTKAIGVGAHPGNVIREDWAGGWANWDFESFMTYCKGFAYTAIPVICVNYSTGTPSEAARWVHYANVVKKYDIRYWQVGNELDGAWEEAGPVSAKMYAEKFIQFARAMKAIDPSIKVFGPVLAGADFAGQASGDFNAKSWMATFLEYVGAREKTDQKKYCDGVDFHSYPYWFENKPDPEEMLERSDYVNQRSDTLLSMIKEYLLGPDSVSVFMSEFNSSVVMSSLLQKPINGICMANMYGGFASHFGSRGMTVIWDSYEGLAVGPDGTSGSLSLFNAADKLLHTSLICPPNAVFWSSYIYGNLWISAGKTLRNAVSVYKPEDGIRAYTVTSGDGFRIMLVNISLDTLQIKTTLHNMNSAITHANIFHWGDREFRWNGTGNDAFAMPNCGPSSKRDAVAALGAITLPPNCMAVAASSSSLKNRGAPQMVHFGAYPKTVRDDDTLQVFGTVLDTAGVICSLSYRIDNAAYNPVSPLDGTCDGPSESWSLVLPGKTLGYGKHRIYIKAQSINGDSVTDFVEIQASGTLKPTLWIDNFDDKNLVSMLPTNARWYKYHCGTDSSTLSTVFDTLAPFGANLRTEFSIVQPGDLSYEVYASTYLALDTIFMDTARPPIRGITFRYASTHSAATGSFVLEVQSNRVKDYDHFNKIIENTGGTWKTLSLSWGDFAQYGWGKPVDSLALKSINKIEFRMRHEGKGWLALDNLAFLSDSGNSVIGIKDLHSHVWNREPVYRQMYRGILFSMPETKNRASLMIYTLKGALVFRADHITPDKKSFYWDCRSSGGQRVPAGLYIARITAPGVTQESKFCLVR